MKKSGSIAALLLAVLGTVGPNAAGSMRGHTAARKPALLCGHVAKQAPARCKLMAINRYWPPSMPLTFELTHARWSKWTDRTAVGRAWDGKIYGRFVLSVPRRGCRAGVVYFTHLNFWQLNLPGRPHRQAFRIPLPC